LEKRRTSQSFIIATGVGVGLSQGLLWVGDFCRQAIWPHGGDFVTGYEFLGVEGLLVGLVLSFLVRYYPAWEGLIASLSIPVSVIFLRWMEKGFQLTIDSFVSELLMPFEAHFACLYFAAFLVFMSRGGGVFYPRVIGLRYLRFKMITGITVIGVALGVAGMTVVLSVMSGLENDLKDKIIGTNAHAIVQKKVVDFDDHKKAIEKIRQVPGVIGATPFVYSEVLVSSDSNLSGVFLRGLDIDTASKVTRLEIIEGELETLRFSGPARDAISPSHSSTPGKQPEEVPMPGKLLAKKREPKKVPGVLIGAELKKILKVRLGQRINVVAPLSQELGPTGPVPKARSFTVVGVFYTGMYDYDAKSIYVDLKQAQTFLELGDSVTGVALKFDDLDRAEMICAQIKETLNGYPFETRTWFQMNKSLFSALKMEKLAMFLVLVIVILVSACGIISTLVMLVWEKVKEIAILKSMGATGDGVMKIFMFEGIVIGLVGTGLGLLLGTITCFVLQNIGLQMDQDVYYIDALPVNMDPMEFMLIAGIALQVSFISTIYPAGRASRLRPVEGLRYD
jgi:lipoprotein-releasing system permease protein